MATGDQNPQAPQTLTLDSPLPSLTPQVAPQAAAPAAPQAPAAGVLQLDSPLPSLTPASGGAGGSWEPAPTRQFVTPVGNKVQQVRYQAPGYGVQEFTAGSTEEQKFLAQHPQAKPIPGSYKRVLQAGEKIESETPQVQQAADSQAVSDSYKDFKARLQEPVRQGEIERLPGLQPDVVNMLREQGKDTLGTLFGKQKADYIREHILNGSYAINVPPEEFARAAAKTLTDWYSPAMLALSAPGRIAHGFAEASKAALATGDAVRAADLAGKARLVGILGTATGVPFVAKQVYSLAENWDGMSPAERSASVMGILGGSLMTGVSAHETGITPSQIGGTAKDVVNTVGNMIPGRGVKTPAESMQAAQDAYYSAIKPGKRAVKDDFRGTLESAMPQLSLIANQNPDASNFPEMAQAVQGHIDGIEGQLKQKGMELRGQPQAVLTGIEGTVNKALEEGFADAGRRYTEAEKEKATEEVMNHLGIEMKKEKDPDTGETSYVLNRTAPTPDIFGADGIRQRFNDDISGSYVKGEVASASNYAKQIALRAIRDGIDKKFTELGIKGVKEWRRQEADLITVKDAMMAAQSRALDEKGAPKEWSALNEMAKMKGWGVLPLVFGLVHPVAGVLGLGANLGISKLQDSRTNPNVLARKAQAHLENAGISPEARVPTFGTNGPAPPKTGAEGAAENPTRGAAETQPAPSSGTTDLSGPIAEYVKSKGLPPIRTEGVQPDPRQEQIADAYKAAQHNPNDPAVKASYDALKRDIKDQYHFFKSLGINMDTAPNNPYGLSETVPAHEELHNDVLNNKHLTVWEGGQPPADHPLSQVDPETGHTYNELFRMVHDIAGHAAERNDFSPAGEESAWNLHRQMFSPEARPALATETRGQAAYTYKYGDFPPQKATLLPKEAQVRPEDFERWSEKVADRAATESAGAVDPLTGLSDTRGKGTEIHPESRQPLDHAPTAEDFRAFAEKNKAVLERHPNWRIGWDNESLVPGGHELNIGAAGPGAERVAQKLEQRGAYDIENQKVIPTGGTGLRTQFPEYSEEERNRDLMQEPPKGPTPQKTATAEAPRGSTTDLLTNPIPRTDEELALFADKVHKGLSLAGTTVADFQKTMGEWVRAVSGKISKPSALLTRAINIAADEVNHWVMENGGEGKGWYRKLTADAIDIMKQKHPSLEDPTKQGIFKLLWAAHSYGTNPDLNMREASQNFSNYENTGKFAYDKGVTNPETGRPVKWSGHSGNVYTMAKGQHLIDTLGEQGAMDWLTSKHTWPEIQEQFKDSGLNVSKSDIPFDEDGKTYGAHAFGPKGGAFFLNLNGINDHTVVDIWGARSLRRWEGRAGDPNTLSKDPQTGLVSDKPPTGDEIKRYHKVAQAVGDKLDLDVDDVQALQWYYEHKLYEVHGAGEAARDYTEAARNVVKGKPPSGPLSATDFLAAFRSGGNAEAGGGNAGGGTNAETGGLFEGNEGSRGPTPRKVAAAPYHEDLQKVADKYGLTDDPAVVKNGASFITPDGRFIPLGTVEHPDAIRWAGAGSREDFIDQTGAIRVRFNARDKAGPTTHISVPADGVKEEQIPAIAQAIAQAGRNGNVVMERSDVTPETADKLSMSQDFPRMSDVEDYLRRIDAHPDQHGGPTPKKDLLDRMWRNMFAPGDTIDDVHHELGHAIVGDAVGIGTADGVRSDRHPENAGTGAVASMPMDYPHNWFDRQGNFTAFDHLDDLLTMFMGGGAGEEVFSGIPMEGNRGMDGDFKYMRETLKDLGYTHAEAEAKIKAAGERAKDILTKSKAADIVKKYSGEREEGLHEVYHMSKERVEQIKKEIRDGQNKGTPPEGSAPLGNAAGDVGRGAGIPSENVASTEGGGAGGAGQEAAQLSPLKKTGEEPKSKRGSALLAGAAALAGPAIGGLAALAGRRKEQPAPPPAVAPPAPVVHREIPEIVDQAARDNGIPAEILRAQARQESGLNARAISRKGAKGVMQLMDPVSNQFGVTDPYDPEQNIPAGAQYLAQLHHRLGRWDRALGAYNWGADHVKTAVAEHGDNWLEYAPLETQNYVRSILKQK